MRKSSAPSGSMAGIEPEGEVQRSTFKREVGRVGTFRETFRLEYPCKTEGFTESSCSTRSPPPPSPPTPPSQQPPLPTAFIQQLLPFFCQLLQFAKFSKLQKLTKKKAKVTSFTVSSALCTPAGAGLC